MRGLARDSNKKLTSWSLHGRFLWQAKYFGCKRQRPVLRLRSRCGAMSMFGLGGHPSWQVQGNPRGWWSQVDFLLQVQENRAVLLIYRICVFSCFCSTCVLSYVSCHMCALLHSYVCSQMRALTFVVLLCVLLRVLSCVYSHV